MKKVLFWLLGIISVVIAFKIGNIIIYDINRLTEYGFGYLTGLIIAFLITLGLSVFLGFKVFRKNHLP
ncbi:MAG: hypothetical protein HN691_11755 [Bacteroidetes bacterium]|nr:hypothetical protein [Bacteroidota bacterium]